MAAVPDRKPTAANAFVTFRAISATGTRLLVSIALRNSLNGLHALARILPLPKSMGRSTGSAGALIEILNLCAETLTSLHSDQDIAANAAQPGAGHAPTGKNMNTGRHLVVIQGGLSAASRRAASR
jgi:hypothetical protein